MDKRIMKKNNEELQQYLLLFKRRGSKVKAQKGKGSFTRKIKYKKGEGQDV